MITTKTILDTTVYGEPSGNYDGSSLEWFSDAQPAANYYRGRGNAQTVSIRVTDFQGQLVIQSTLDSDPLTASWFDVYDYDRTSSTTDYHPVNIPGNFTWMRVKVVDFSAGTIDSVTVSY